MFEGHCLCCRTRFRIAPPWRFVGHCHCESCRRQTASAATTFAGVPDGQWEWLGMPPALYESSPGTRRFFCPGCGAQAAYQADRLPGEAHFYAALLEDPGALRPHDEYHLAEALPWTPLRDSCSPAQ